MESMQTSQRIAVIGLGRFGMALARRLSKHGAEVIAIDSTASVVNDIKDDVAIAVCLDATDESALRSQEVDRVDACIVAIGENFEAALLTTVICKTKLELANVICRAQTGFHAQIFQQIGADEVVQPEQTAGDMLGRRLAHPQISDYVQLGDGFTIVEMRPPPAFVGRTVQDVNLRSEWSVNLIAIRRPIRVAPQEDDDSIPPPSATRLIAVPGPRDQIEQSDLLVIAGTDESLSKLAQI
jgi:trk/ktr system potassium uptake protein